MTGYCDSALVEAWFAQELCPVLRPGQVLLADEARPLGILFGELRDGLAIDRATERMTLVAVRVRGVPMVIAEEALWIAVGVLTAES